MTKTLILNILILLYCVAGNLWAQGNKKQEYLHGKELYSTGHNGLAMDVLKPLTLPSNKSAYTPYAGYYYSLAAWKEGYTFLGEEMLTYLLKEYPNWEYADLCRIWLVKIYLKEEDYEHALEISGEIRNASYSDPVRNLLENGLANGIDLQVLKDLYERFPDIKALGVVLADKIRSQPAMEQDRSLLVSIVKKYDLNRNKYNIVEDLPEIRKDTYNVAVLLPFMFDDLIPNQSARSNQFVLDIYEGMKIARKELAQEGIQIRLYAFDTKKQAYETEKIINTGQLDGIDLILGPLFPGPVKVVSDFSLKNRINMYNPLSTNSELLNQNPFSFLFRPTNERQAEAAADYVKDKLDNKNAFIFYDNTERDSAMAFSYRKAIEMDSFHVILMHRISERDTSSIYSILSQKVKFSDVARTAEDSMRLIERYDLYGYFDKLARARSEKDRKKIRPLEIFVIAPDSIGQVFVATGRELISANTISGVETRGDSITIIGEESWMYFPNVSLEQFEMLKLVLIAPGYISPDNPNLSEINDKFLNTVYSPPSRYHYIGYEMMHFLGNMLSRYGVYFQTGMRTMGTYPGILYQGFNYTDSNDNSIVPIIRFENSEFDIVNKEKFSHGQQK